MDKPENADDLIEAVERSLEDGLTPGTFIWKRSPA